MLPHRRLIAAALALAIGTARAEPIDAALTAGALGMMAIDWAQTRTIARQARWMPPECADPGFRAAPAAANAQCHLEPVYREINPLLPSHPSAAEVDRYFALAMIGTAGLAYALPAPYRRYFLGGVLILESAIVAHNYHIGIGVRF